MYSPHVARSTKCSRHHILRFFFLLCFLFFSINSRIKRSSSEVSIVLWFSLQMASVVNTWYDCQWHIATWSVRREAGSGKWEAGSVKLYGAPALVIKLCACLFLDPESYYLQTHKRSFWILYNYQVVFQMWCFTFLFRFLTYRNQVDPFVTTSPSSKPVLGLDLFSLTTCRSLSVHVSSCKDEFRTVFYDEMASKLSLLLSDSINEI